MKYVPDAGSGGNGSNHKGQSKHNEGGKGTQRESLSHYPASSISHGGDTPKPKDGSKKSPKIFG